MSTEFYHIDHGFGQDRTLPAEGKTKIVIIITLIAMLGEVFAGLIFGSMALLADGIHMASHVFAMTISFLAYRYIRKNAHNPKFSFGTGKINALAGYTGAIILVLFALAMAYESVHRMLEPQSISFNAAILVACLGLGINLLCALVMGHKHEHSHKNHNHSHCHDHAHTHDSNFKAIYLHIITDALTSLLAIAALLAGKFFNATWLDPCMGILGAILIIWWAQNLLRESGSTLLDHQVSAIGDQIKSALAHFQNLEILDLHTWAIGHQIYAGELILAVDEHTNALSVKQCLHEIKQLVHLTVEIHCKHCEENSLEISK